MRTHRHSFGWRATGFNGRLALTPHSTVPIKAAPKPNLAYPQFYYGGGLGWQLRDCRGRKIAMHSGSSGAIAAMMPEEKIGVVVLTNRSCGIEFMFMHDIFARMLGLPRPMANHDWLVETEGAPAKRAAATNARLEAARIKESKPSLPLAKFAGTYHCDLYGKLELQERDGSLRLQFGPNIDGTLVHWKHDTFRAKLSFPPGEEWLLRFRAAKGQVDRLHVERISWPEPMPEFRRTE